MSVLTLTGKKDPGALDCAGEVFPDMNLRQCVLSMTGAKTRSRFLDCTFGKIKGIDCVVGHAVFERCNFDGVEANCTLTLFDALFLECQFSGVLRLLNFGCIRSPSPFFSEDRHQSDVAQMRRVEFSLDLSKVSRIEECSFLGDDLVKKLRFKEGQGVIVSGEDLQSALKSLLIETSDMGLASFLASPVGFGENQHFHFLPAPNGSVERLQGYVRLLQHAGVKVHMRPLC